MIAVKYTTRNDGNDKPIRGWYVTHFGVPVGKGRQTQHEAGMDALAFARELRAMKEIPNA